MVGAPKLQHEGRRVWLVLPPCADGTLRRVLVEQIGLTKDDEESIKPAEAA